MKKWFIIFICSFSFSQENITLQKAIEYTLKNSHEIAIAKNDNQIINNNTSLGAAGMLPNISVSSGYDGSIANSAFEFNPILSQSFSDSNCQCPENKPSEIVESENPVQEANNALSSRFSSSLSFSYTLSNVFSGIYTLKKFKYLDESSKENVRYQIENKIIDVVVKYYEYLNLKKINSVLQETYNISQDRYNRLLERYEFGSISNLELLNAEADLNTDLINLNNSSLNLKISKNNLHVLMGISDTISLVIEDQIVFNNNINLEDLKIKTALNNSSILMAQLNYNIARQDLKISRSNLSPKIDLITSFSFSDIGSQTGFISKQNDQSFFAGVNIQVPIFSGNLRRTSIKNSKINLNSKQHQLEVIQDNIYVSLLNTYESYMDGLNNLDIQEKSLNTFESNFKKSEELYLLGQLSSVDFRESQVNLMNFKMIYSSNLFNTKIQEFILYQLSGLLNY